MACGKPPDPDARTSPTPLSHPVVAPVAAALAEAESIISKHPPGRSVDAAIARAERVLQNALGNGVREAIAQKLQGRLEHLKGFAQSRMRDNVYSSAKPRSIQEKGASYSGKRSFNRMGGETLLGRVCKEKRADSSQGS